MLIVVTFLSKNSILPLCSFSEKGTLVISANSSAITVNAVARRNKVENELPCIIHTPIIGPIAIDTVIDKPYQPIPSPRRLVGITSVIEVPIEVVEIAQLTP